MRRAGRYGDHLFPCFDDPRIPATSNDLERFFGDSKQALRAALGCGSTTNSVLTNLGDEALAAHHHVRRAGMPTIDAIASCPPAEFEQARARIARQEAPAIRQRSMVRSLPRRLDKLRSAWFGGRQPPGPNA